MPMRSETDWAIEMTPDLNYVQLLPIIKAIQRDALEAAAKAVSDLYDATGNTAGAERLIRALVPTDGSAKGDA